MISSEGIDCNPGVTRGLKSPPRPGQKSVLLAERFTVVPDSCVALPLSATPTSLPVTPEATGSSPVHPASFRQGSRQLAGLPSCVSRMSPSQSPTSRRLPERTSRNCARQIPCTPPSRIPACRLTRFAPDASRVHGICSQHSCCLSQTRRFSSQRLLKARGATVPRSKHRPLSRHRSAELRAVRQVC